MSTAVKSSLPRYKCHKEVQAVKIASIERGTHDAVLIPASVEIPSFSVSAEYLAKHNPQIGGYFVVYEDGYESFSPAKAFEEGYTRI